MKNLKYISLLLLFAVGLSSCADVLEQEMKSSVDSETMYSSYDLAEAANYGAIYAIIGRTSNFRARFHPWYGLNSDIEWYLSFTGTNRPIAAYNLEPNNSVMNTASDNNAYSMMYEGIERLNLNVKNLREYGNVQNDKDMAFILGEALVLRATVYYDLLRGWGDVPARFEPVSPETIYLPKADRDVIYKQLLADLKEAATLLPWPGEGRAMTIDRANRAYAQGLYARIALMASGYALRPDEGQVGTGNLGSVRKSSDPELQKSVLYPQALDALEDVIQNSGCRLYADYTQIWTDLGAFNLDASTVGKEVLWVYPYGDNRGRWNYTFAVRDDDATRAGGAAGPVPTLFFDYDKSDLRRDLSCVNWKWSKGEQVPAGMDRWYFGKYRVEWMTKNNWNREGNDCGYKPPYMRYSDILLMAAEIANDSEGGVRDENKAKSYLAEVRARAFGPNAGEAQAQVSSLAGEQAIFEAIVNERAFEFVGEMIRKQDLIRWGMLKEKIDETSAKMLQLSKLEGKYANLPRDFYYRYNKQGEIEFWGFNEGENVTPDATWMKPQDSKGKPYTYIPDDTEDETKNLFYDSSFKGNVAATYYDANPDTRQYWPIFQNVIDMSQGKLVNDYGY